ncbi:MAG: hypothetical protein ACFE8J_19060 [Candidatus Heimdallarchaeota archaeon]
MGKLDRKACLDLEISPAHSGKDISEFLTPENASEIVEALKKLVIESHKLLTSDSIY